MVGFLCCFVSFLFLFFFCTVSRVAVCFPKNLWSLFSKLSRQFIFPNFTVQLCLLHVMQQSDKNEQNIVLTFVWYYPAHSHYTFLCEQPIHQHWAPVWLTNLMQMSDSKHSASSAAQCILSAWLTIGCIILGLMTRTVCTYPQAVWKRRVCWVSLWVLE